MPKLSIKANPTFKAKVGIPEAGGTVAEVEFTFKHRSRSELSVWLEENKSKTNVDYLMGFVLDWDCEEPFNQENLEKFLDDRMAAPQEVTQKYLSELYQQKLGNSER